MAGGSVNIRRVRLPLASPTHIILILLQDISDPFYRYKMERLQSKIEGKGNGIKTVVVNLSNVAQQLARPPTCKCLQLSSNLHTLTTCRRHQVLRFRTRCPDHQRPQG